MSSETRPPRDAGFLLLEVLAAIFISLLFVSVLTSGFRTAWSRSRHPAEVTWAMALAQKAAEDARNGVETDSNDLAGFSYDVSEEPLALEDLHSTLPPMAHSLSSGSSLSQQKPVAPGQLKLVTVTVTDASGQHYTYETFKLTFPQTAE